MQVSPTEKCGPRLEVIPLTFRVSLFCCIARRMILTRPTCVEEHLLPLKSAMLCGRLGQMAKAFMSPIADSTKEVESRSRIPCMLRLWTRLLNSCVWVHYWSPDKRRVFARLQQATESYGKAPAPQSWSWNVCVWFIKIELSCMTPAWLWWS